MAGEVFELRGDGECKAEQLASLKTVCEQWNRRAGNFYAKREEWERTRGCVWDGQSPDGRSWDDVTDERTAGLFDGALDLRVRWADQVTLEEQATLMGALALAQVSVVGAGPNAQVQSGAMTTLLQWMIRNMGSRWLWQWMLLTNWYAGDTPAVAQMAVSWKRDVMLGYTKVTADALQQAWLAREMARAGEDQYAQADAMDAAGAWWQKVTEGDALALEQAAVLVRQLTGAAMADARRAVKGVLADGEAEVLAPEQKSEGPKIEARRYGDDFVVADNCRDFEGETVWFAPEWLTVAELRGRIGADGWDEAFVKSVEEQGETAVLSNGPEGYDRSPGEHAGRDAKTDRRQVVWGFVTGVDEEGNKGRYVCVFGSGDKTAFGWRLLRGRRGGWPAAFFTREGVSKYQLGSRGVVELAGPYQGVAKALKDMKGNNGLIGSLPPIGAKGHSVKNQYVAPLRIIGMNVNEEFQFMRPPEFPAAASQMAGEIEAEMRNYFGLSHEKADAQTVQERKRVKVNWFLAQASDVLRMMLELAQDNASDEWLAMVTDERGDGAGIGMEMIRGNFGLTVSLNADDMDAQQVVEKIKAVGQVLLSMDRNQTIDTGPIVAHGLMKLLPDVGPRALRGPERAQEDEEREEAENLSMIRAGVMPRMNTEGRWNYEARLAMYQRMEQENPKVFDDMAPDKREMLAKWMEALAQQAKQFGVNREIGRTGVEGVGE